MNKSSSRNPVELVDRYLQAVRFWLPKKQQQDVDAELSEDLHSQIEEKEVELGRPLDEGEVSAILKRCGSPIAVAARFRPQGYLIGPALFPIYRFVLKMVLLWILVPVFLFIVGPVNLVNTGDWGLASVRTLGDLWNGAFIAAAAITLIFAVLESTQAHLGLVDKWDPRSLPPVQKESRKPSMLKAVCELGFGTFGFMWLLLVPHYPVLIFGPAAAFLQLGPVWHSLYFLFVGMSVIGLVRSSIILGRPQWTWFPPLSQLMNTILALIVLNVTLHAVTQPPNGQALVVLADAMQASPRYIRLAAIVNASVLISLAAAWLGLCIATVVQAWEFLRYLRHRTAFIHAAASIGAL
jgi:hypothetical protein